MTIKFTTDSVKILAIISYGQVKVCELYLYIGKQHNSILAKKS